MAGDDDAELLSSDNFFGILRVNVDSDEEEEGIELRHQGIIDDEEEEEYDGKQHPEEEDLGHPDALQHQEIRLSSLGTALLIRHVPSRGLSFQIWRAAATMVALLDRDPTLLVPSNNRPASRPLHLLELGSGTGLVGIAAAAALGARVTLTDLPHVVPNLLHNAATNATTVAARGGEVLARQLRWGDVGDAADAIAAAGKGDDGSGFDLVLGSDVVYYEHLIDPLIRTVRDVVRGDTAFVMAHLRRWKRRDALFFRKARKVFEVEVLHKDPPLPEWRSGVVVYRFVQKKKKQEVLHK